MAFQIIDDVLDYNADRAKLGKTIGDDFREGKMTAPVILAIENATEKEREFWQRTLGEKQQTEGDIEIALDLMVEYGSMNKGLELARQYGHKAISNISTIENSTLKNTLEAIVTFTIEREF